MTDNGLKVDEYLSDQIDAPHLSPRLIIEKPILPSLTVWVRSDGQEGRIQRWYDISPEILDKVGIRSLDFFPDGFVKLLDKDGNEICSKKVKLTDDFDGIFLILARIEKAWSFTKSASQFWSIACNILLGSRVPIVEEIEAGFYLVKRTDWLELACFWIAFLSKMRHESGESGWEELLFGENLIFRYIDFYNSSPHRGPQLREPLYDIDRVHLKALLDAVRRATSNIEKKETLETLARHLLRGVSGFIIIPSMITATGQIDCIVRNHVTHPILAKLGSHILVECKNWNRTIGTDQLGSFINDIQDAGLNSGFLFSRRSISKPAKQRIINAYQRDRLFIIGITGNDINAICDGANFSQMLIEKLESIMFQR